MASDVADAVDGANLPGFARRSDRILQVSRGLVIVGQARCARVVEGERRVLADVILAFNDLCDPQKAKEIRRVEEVFVGLAIIADVHRVVWVEC